MQTSAERVCVRRRSATSQHENLQDSRVCDANEPPAVLVVLLPERSHGLFTERQSRAVHGKTVSRLPMHIVHRATIDLSRRLHAPFP